MNRSCFRWCETAGAAQLTTVANDADKIFNAKKYLAELTTNGFVSSGTNYTNTGTKQVMIEGVKYELVTQLAGLLVKLIRRGLCKFITAEWRAHTQMWMLLGDGW